VTRDVHTFRNWTRDVQRYGIHVDYAAVGSTTFAYNLSIDGQRVTNLRPSGDNIAKIFTGVTTRWNDPAIAADDPG
jgi:ABC-type phosphate transport system substrate-binding protein